MTKLIKKKDCKFKAGHIIRKDKVVGIPTCVWLQLNKLELMVQQYLYLQKQPSYQKAPSLEGFVRESALKGNRPYIECPDTPVSDRRFQEAMAFMAEQDAVQHAAETNEMIDRFGALIDWLAGNKFIEGDCKNLIDTPKLGNPLELKPDQVASILHMIATSPIELGE